MPIVCLAFLCALLVGVVLTRGIRDLALARGWLDVAQSSRKVHTKPIPRLGGVGIVCGFFVALGVLLMSSTEFYERFQADARFAYGLLGGGLTIALLGLYDDFVGTRARQKFLVQFGVAIALCAAGLRVEVITNPFGEPVSLGLLAWPFTVIWIVGVINALNLIDGLDGLAGGVAFIGTGTSFVLALAREDFLMAGLMAALAGALLGFLIFNFNPASIFMGDTGSMFLGFVLAVASLRTASKSDTAVAMLVPVIALGLPIMDTLLAMGRRKLVGRPMFSADKEHIHHRLMSRLRLSHRGTVLTLYALSLFFAAVAVALSFSNGPQSALLLLSLVTVSGLLLRRLGFLDRAALEQMVQSRKRNQQLRGVVESVCRQAAKASSVDALWTSLQPLADVLRVHQLSLRGTPKLGWSFNDLSLQSDVAPEPRAALQANIPVSWDGVGVGVLVAEWRDGRSDIVRDEELALERVAHIVGRVIVRRNLGQNIALPAFVPEMMLPPIRPSASGSTPRAVPGSRA